MTATQDPPASTAAHPSGASVGTLPVLASPADLGEQLKAPAKGLRKGYQVFYSPEHPHADLDGRVLLHVALAARALGKPLPEGAEVHHVNGKRADNSRGNLVLCPDRAYHQLLHQRTRALMACGHADWRRCFICKQYDEPANVRGPHHPECRRKYARQYTKTHRARDRARATANHRRWLEKKRRVG